MKILAKSKYTDGWYDPDAPDDKRNYGYDPAEDGLTLFSSGIAARCRLDQQAAASKVAH